MNKPIYYELERIGLSLLVAMGIVAGIVLALNPDEVRDHYASKAERQERPE